jgi:SCY1-like protein 1
MWLFGGGSAKLPATAGEVVASYEGKTAWSLHEGVLKLNGSAVSIFKMAVATAAGSNAMKRLRTLRHPCVLSFVDGVEGDDIFMVTERVTPLSEWIADNAPNEEGDAADAVHFEAAVAWGLRRVAHALAFIGTDCKLVHGSLSLNTVFVAANGDWKVGGLDLLSALEDGLPSALIRNNVEAQPRRYRAPEHAARKWRKGGRPWALDAWSLGVLIDDVWQLAGRAAQPPKAVATIVLRLKDEGRAGPPRRLNPKRVVDAPYLVRHPFVKCCLFLEEVALKSPEEIVCFLHDIFADPATIVAFPPAACTEKILPVLLDKLRAVLTSSGVDADPTAAAKTAGVATAMLAPALRVGRLLPPERFQSEVLPHVVALFKCSNRGVRKQLLQVRAFRRASRRTRALRAPRVDPLPPAIFLTAQNAASLRATRAPTFLSSFFLLFFCFFSSFFSFFHATPRCRTSSSPRSSKTWTLRLSTRTSSRTSSRASPTPRRSCASSRSKR